MSVNLSLVSIHIEPSARAVPLGSAMLASMLKKTFSDRLNTDVIDLYLDQDPSECADLILRSDPDYVGFSLYIWNRSLALQIVDLLRERKPDLVIFAGGPEVSADNDETLENDAIDFVLLGECEENIVKVMELLLKGGALDEISKLKFSSYIKDLSVLSSPFLDGTIDPADYSGILWELSRGCPFHCAFCYESRGIQGVRRFPIERICSELDLFAKAGVEQIFVLDPTFNYNKNTAKEILHLIMAKAPEVYFFFEVRSEFLDSELAELFASVRCTLQIGLQSCSDKVLKNINRRIDKDDFMDKIFLLHEAGVSYGFDLIYGLPGDTLEGFYASLDFAMSLVPNHIDIFPLTVLPSTVLHDEAASFGLKHQIDNPYQAISSPSFSSQDMQDATELAKAFDLFYNQGKAVPWFGLLINVLEITPSGFFIEFAKKLQGDYDKDLIALQKDFVGNILASRNKCKFIPLMNDIITYFGYDESSKEYVEPLSFNHNPIELIELLDSGVTDLNELYILLPKEEYQVSPRVP